MSWGPRSTIATAATSLITASTSITLPGTSTSSSCEQCRIAMRRKFAAAFLTFSIAACTSIGPGTVPHDRIDYASAIGNSWKEQTLLNIVKLRYADMPIFLEVAQVIAGYQLQSAIGGELYRRELQCGLDRTVHGDRQRECSRHLHRSAYGDLSATHRRGFLEEANDANSAQFRVVHAPVGLFRGSHYADHVGFDKRLE